jgi:hypothetical protein
MKQTAVEWLRQELLKRDMDISIKDLFEQAKEMEKQQIMDAHNQGYADGYRDNGNSPIDYYSETFKSEQ